VVYLQAPPPALLTLADEEGLFVVEQARSWLAPREAETELLDLIRRDRAHASVLAWNLGSADSEAVASARKLDPTRFVLTGTGAVTRIYAPHSDGGAPSNPPAGLIPGR